MADRGSIRIRRKRRQQPRDLRPAMAVDPNQIAMALAPFFPAQARPSSPLVELAEGWLPRKTASMESGGDFECRVRKWLIPFLGAHTDVTLRKKHVEEWLAALAKQKSRYGRPLGAQSIRHAWDAGRQLINDAMSNGEWSGSNPFDMAGAPSVPIPESDCPSAEQAGRFLMALPPLWVPLYATAIYLGPRRGGLRKIRKSDVDTTAWTIWLPADKTSKRRLVPIPNELQPFVKFALALNPGSEWLFGQPDGAQLGKWVKLNPMLRRAMKAVGLEMRLTFHGLRRVSSSAHQEAGCHPWVVSRILGHSQAGLVIAENMTARRYTKFSDDFVRRELNKLTLFPKGEAHGQETK